MKFEEFEKEFDEIVEKFKAHTRNDKTLHECEDKMEEGDWFEFFVMFYGNYESE